MAFVRSVLLIFLTYLIDILLRLFTLFPCPQKTKIIPYISSVTLDAIASFLYLLGLPKMVYLGYVWMEGFGKEKKRRTRAIYIWMEGFGKEKKGRTRAIYFESH